MSDSSPKVVPLRRWRNEDWLLPHIAVRCRPLTSEDRRALTVQSHSSVSSVGVVAAAYPIAVHSKPAQTNTDGGRRAGHANRNADADQKELTVAVTRFTRNGVPRTEEFPAVFDAVHVPESLGCFVRLRPYWDAVSPEGSGYTALLDLASVDGDDAIMALQILRQALTNPTRTPFDTRTTLTSPTTATGISSSWAIGQFTGREKREEEDCEAAELQRDVEQLTFIDPLCFNRRGLRGTRHGMHPATSIPSVRWGPTTSEAQSLVDPIDHLLLGTNRDATENPQRGRAMNENDAAKPIVPLLRDGYQVAVIAYGAARSGKSYTLHGSGETSGGTAGLISHVVRGLLGGAERCTVRMAFVAFQEDPPNHGDVSASFVYDLWNPASFGAVRRTVRLARASSWPSRVDKTGNSEEKVHHAKLATSETELAPLLVEGAVWLDVHAESEVSSFSHKGLDQLSLLREKLNLLAAYGPLHTAILLRAARSVQVQGDNLRKAYHAEAVFMELDWTPRVADGTIIRHSLLHNLNLNFNDDGGSGVQNQATSSMSSGDAASLLLTAARHGAAKLFLLPHVHVSPPHAREAADALRVATHCAQFCRRPLRFFVPSLLDPTEVLRREAEIMATAAVTDHSDVFRRRRLVLDASLRQLETAPAERLSSQRSLIAAWRMAVVSTRQSLLRAWVGPPKRAPTYFASMSEEWLLGRQRLFLLLLPPTGVHLRGSSRGHGDRDDMDADEMDGTALAAMHSETLHSFPDLLTPMFIDVESNSYCYCGGGDMGDGGPPRPSLQLRFGPPEADFPLKINDKVNETVELIMRVGGDGVAQLRAARYVAADDAKPLDVHTTRMARYGSPMTHNNKTMNGSGTPLVSVNGTHVEWCSTPAGTETSWISLSLGSRVIVGSYAFLLLARASVPVVPSFQGVIPSTSALSVDVGRAAVAIMDAARAHMEVQITLQECHCRLQLFEWHRRRLRRIVASLPLQQEHQAALKPSPRLGKMSSPPKSRRQEELSSSGVDSNGELDSVLAVENRRRMQMRWVAVERDVLVTYHGLMQERTSTIRQLLWAYLIAKKEKEEEEEKKKEAVKKGIEAPEKERRRICLAVPLPCDWLSTRRRWGALPQQLDRLLVRLSQRLVRLERLQKQHRQREEQQQWRSHHQGNPIPQGPFADKNGKRVLTNGKNNDAEEDEKEEEEDDGDKDDDNDADENVELLMTTLFMRAWEEVYATGQSLNPLRPHPTSIPELTIGDNTEGPGRDTMDEYGKKEPRHLTEEELLREQESLEQYLSSQLDPPQALQIEEEEKRTNVTENEAMKKVRFALSNKMESFIYPKEMAMVRSVLRSCGGHPQLCHPASSLDLLVHAFQSNANVIFDANNTKDGDNIINQNKVSFHNEDDPLNILTPQKENVNTSDAPSPSIYVFPIPRPLPLDRDLRRLVSISTHENMVSSEQLMRRWRQTLLLELLTFLAESERARLWKPNGPTILEHRREYDAIMNGKPLTFRKAIDRDVTDCDHNDDDGSAVFLPSSTSPRTQQVTGVLGETAEPPSMQMCREAGLVPPFHTIHTLCAFAQVFRIKRGKSKVLSGEGSAKFRPTAVVIRGHFLYHFDVLGRPQLNDVAKGGCYLLGATILSIAGKKHNKQEANPLAGALVCARESSAGYESQSTPSRGYQTQQPQPEQDKQRVGHEQQDMSSSVRKESPLPNLRPVFSTTLEEDPSVMTDCDENIPGVGIHLSYFIKIIPSVPRSASTNHLFDTQENHILLGFPTREMWEEWKTWLLLASMPVPSARLQRHFEPEHIEDAALAAFMDLQTARQRLHRNSIFSSTKKGVSTPSAIVSQSGLFRDTGRPLPLTDSEVRSVVGAVADMSLHSHLSAMCSSPSEDLFWPVECFSRRFMQRRQRRECSELEVGLRRALRLLFLRSSDGERSVVTTPGHSFTGSMNVGGIRFASSAAGGRRPYIGALAVPSVVLPLEAIPFATQLRTAFVTRVAGRQFRDRRITGSSSSVTERSPRGRGSRRREQQREHVKKVNTNKHAKEGHKNSNNDEYVHMDEQDGGREEEEEEEEGGEADNEEDIPMNYRTPFRHSKLLDVDRIHEQRYATHVWLVDHFTATISCTTGAPEEEDPRLRYRGYIRSVVYQSYELLHLGRRDSRTGDDVGDNGNSYNAIGEIGDGTRSKGYNSQKKTVHNVTFFAESMEKRMNAEYGITLVFYRDHPIVYNDYFVDLRERERFIECITAIRPTIRAFVPALTAAVLSPQRSESETDEDPLLTELLGIGDVDVHLRAAAPLASLSRAASFWTAVLRPLQQSSGGDARLWNVKIDATLFHASEYETRRVGGISPFSPSISEMVHTGQQGKDEEKGWHTFDENRALLDSILSTGSDKHKEHVHEHTCTVRLEGTCGLQISGEATVQLVIWTGTINLEGVSMENPASLRKWLDLLAPQLPPEEKKGMHRPQQRRKGHLRTDDEVEKGETVEKEKEIIEDIDALMQADVEQDVARFILGRRITNLRDVSQPCGGGSSGGVGGGFLMTSTPWTSGGRSHPGDNNPGISENSRIFDIIALTVQEATFRHTPEHFIDFVQDWFERRGYSTLAVVALETAVVLFVFARRSVACLCGSVHTKRIPLGFTAVHGERGAVLATVDVGLSSICFVSICLPTIPSHTSMRPLVIATHCAMIREVLAAIPAGTRGDLVAPMDTHGDPETDLAVDDVVCLAAVRRAASTVDGLAYYDHAFLMGHWGFPLLLPESQALEVSLSDVIDIPLPSTHTTQDAGSACMTTSDTSCSPTTCIADFLQELRGAIAADEALPPLRGRGAVASLANALLRNHDTLTALRRASLLLSPSSGVFEPAISFPPTSRVVPGSTQYSLRQTGNKPVAGVPFSYPARILFTRQFGKESLHCDAIPKAYGSVPPLPPIPRPMRLRAQLQQPSRSTPGARHTLHRRGSRRRRPRHMGRSQKEELLLSSHLPVAAVFTLRVLRPAVGGALWGRDAAAQPGAEQSWQLCLRHLLIALDAPLMGTLAVVVQFVPFLARPVLLHCEDAKHETIQHPLTPDEPEKVVEMHAYTLRPRQTRMGRTGERFVAALSLLPHHAALLAHARMLLSVFDCVESTAQLVGSASMPLLDVMHATIDLAAAVGLGGGAPHLMERAEEVELPSQEVLLRRCGQSVGVVRVSCAPLMCVGDFAIDDDLL